MKSFTVTAGEAACTFISSNAPKLFFFPFNGVDRRVGQPGSMLRHHFR
jgi:hypothetical protein